MTDEIARSRNADLANEALLDLVEEITDRLQAGERVNLDELVTKYPQHADQIRQLFPAMQAVEALGDTSARNGTREPTVSETPSRVLGDFRILGEIGRGGMGVVYEAEQISLGRRVALKVLPFAAVLDPRQLKRFKNEAQAAAALHHTNIVPVYAVGCERGVHYYAMQYIEGQTVADVIDELRAMQGVDSVVANKGGSSRPASFVISKLASQLSAMAEHPQPHSRRVADSRHGRDSQAETSRGAQAMISTDHSTRSPAYFRSIAELGIQIGEALDHAHTEGIIHRDVKPSNLILEPTGRVWITDFGLARLENDAGLTMTGDLIGTLRYMSPEQALAKRIVVDHRTDIYSMGVTLYELLTLQPAFDGADRQELLRQIAFEEPKRLRKVNRRIPEELETIIQKATAKNPAERYATAAEVADDLRRFLEDKPIHAKRPTLRVRFAKWRRRHRPLVASAAAILGILLLATAAICIIIARNAETTAQEMVLVNSEINDALSAAQQLRTRAEHAENDKLTLLTEARQVAEGARVLAGRRLVDPDLRSRAEELVRVIDADVNSHRQYTSERTERVRQAREEWIPRLQQLLDDGNTVDAYILGRQIGDVLPDDVVLRECSGRIAMMGSIVSEPTGAQVEVKHWRNVDGDWYCLGETPLTDSTIPRGVVRFRITLSGYNPVETLRELNDKETIHIALERSTTKTRDMVTVVPSDNSDPFSMDRYEVTNSAYQKFVDAGGYRKPEHWPDVITKDGQPVSWPEAIKEFIDATGKSGPSTWVDGHYPEGQAEYPVRGVSWYEACAYAQFAGKNLPTSEHWETAANRVDAPYLLPFSNFSGKGPMPTGANKGIGIYGIYDLAGNIREWCLTPAAGDLRCVRGGSWDDPSYMYGNVQMLTPFARDTTLGFRCVIYSNDPVIEPASVSTASSITRQATTTPEELERLKSYYSYSKDLPLNPTVAGVDESPANYVHETIELDAAYGERFAVHLFLPKDVQRPYQAILYVPGLGARYLKKFADAEFATQLEWRQVMQFVGTGRAVCWPVVKGTFDRNPPGLSEEIGDIQRGKDIFRSLDYLETRSDIDFGRMTFLGMSWGGYTGPIYVCLEKRFKACVLVAGGLPAHIPPPPSDPARFAPFVTVPVLMVNGVDDELFPLETSQKGLLSLLGSQDKHLENVPGTHVSPILDTQEYIDQWLALRLGPVVRTDSDLTSEERLRRLESQATRLIAWEKFGEAEALLGQLQASQVAELGPEHRDTLRVGRLLATVYQKQQRYAKALSAFQDVQAGQQRTLGSQDADTQETERMLRDFCIGTAWDLLKVAEPSSSDCQTALTLANTWLSQDDSSGIGWWLVSRAHYGLGDMQASLKAIDHSLAKDYFVWQGQWLLKAMIQWQLGEYEDARDWYAASVEWLNKADPGFQPLWRLKYRTTQLMKVSDDIKMRDTSTADHIVLYDKLLGRHPNVGSLYYRRGLAYARANTWERASDDFAHSVELMPRSIEILKARAITSLFLKDEAGYRETCRLAWQNCAEEFAAEVVFTATLGTSDLNATELLKVATGPKTPLDTDIQYTLAQAMAKLRFGDVKDAVDSWPMNAEYRDPISLVYRSIANARVGNAYSAQQFLVKARDYAENSLATPDGPEIYFSVEERPLYWCIMRLAIKEAEAIVSQKSSGAAEGDRTENAE